MMSTTSLQPRRNLLAVTRQPLSDPDEALSFSHRHASFFLDSNVFICTTCGFHDQHKTVVLAHIEEQLQWEEGLHAIRFL